MLTLLVVGVLAQVSVWVETPVFLLAEAQALLSAGALVLPSVWVVVLPLLSVGGQVGSSV